MVHLLHRLYEVDAPAHTYVLSNSNSALVNQTNYTQNGQMEWVQVERRSTLTTFHPSSKTNVNERRSLPAVAVLNLRGSEHRCAESLHVLPCHSSPSPSSLITVATNTSVDEKTCNSTEQCSMQIHTNDRYVPRKPKTQIDLAYISFNETMYAKVVVNYLAQNRQQSAFRSNFFSSKSCAFGSCYERQVKQLTNNNVSVRRTTKCSVPISLYSHLIMQRYAASALIHMI